MVAGIVVAQQIQNFPLAPDVEVEELHSKSGIAKKAYIAALVKDQMMKKINKLPRRMSRVRRTLSGRQSLSWQRSLAQFPVQYRGFALKCGHRVYCQRQHSSPGAEVYQFYNFNARHALHTPSLLSCMCPKVPFRPGDDSLKLN